MTTAEIIIIALAAVAAVAAIIAAVLCAVAAKKRGADVDADTLNGLRKMLDESADKRKSDIENSIKNVKEVLSSSIETTSRTTMTAVNSFVDSGKTTVGSVIENSKAEMKEFRNEQSQNIEKINTGLEKNMKELKDGVMQSLKEVKEGIASQYRDTRQELKQNLEEIKKEQKQNLDEVRKDNRDQLEKMRETVDEKLSKTLEERLNNSFDLVKKELNIVNENLAQMQKLGENVKDINKVFQGVKTRGSWGETALDSLLGELLDSSQYYKQYQIGRSNRVDFAIRMPGKEKGNEVLLPLDSKFPIENYEKLVEAQNNGDTVNVNRFRKALENDLKTQATSIKNKYISPPKTTDFAVMYLPSEGLYAEAMSIAGLSERLRQDQQVVLGGPSVMAALLNSLQMGFRSIQVEKNSNEIRKAFARFTKDFGKLREYIGKAKERSESVTKTLGEAIDRNDKIQKTVDKFAISSESEAAAEIDAPVSEVGDEG